MGRRGKHMMGLSSSTLSLAYIIGPILAGFIAQMVGEKMTFSIMGIFMSVVAIFLLMVTPRKLRLPQTEIQTWD
jgi:MFS family permease